MTIEEAVKCGLWKEKIITTDKEIEQDSPDFEKAKQLFLNGDKETKKWILVTYKCSN